MRLGSLETVIHTIPVCYITWTNTNMPLVAYCRTETFRSCSQRVAVSPGRCIFSFMRVQKVVNLTIILDLSV